MEAISSTLGERRALPIRPPRGPSAVLHLPIAAPRVVQTPPPPLLPVARPCPWACVRQSGMPTSAGLRIFKSHYTRPNPRKAGRNFRKRKKSAFNQSDDKIQSLLLSEEHRPDHGGTCTQVSTNESRKESRPQSGVQECGAWRDHGSSRFGVRARSRWEGAQRPCPCGLCPQSAQTWTYVQNTLRQCFPGPWSWGTLDCHRHSGPGRAKGGTGVPRRQTTSVLPGSARHQAQKGERTATSGSGKVSTAQGWVHRGWGWGHRRTHVGDRSRTELLLEGQEPRFEPGHLWLSGGRTARFHTHESAHPSGETSKPILGQGAPRDFL